MILATLCYIRKDGKTLMLHRNKKINDPQEGKWNGVGGKFEGPETPEECSIREVKEETGLDIIEQELKGHIVFPNFSHDEDWYVFIFNITKFEGNLIDSPEGTLHWIEDDKIIDLNVYDGDKHFLPWLNQDKFFSAKFIYDKGQYVSHEVNFY